MSAPPAPAPPVAPATLLTAAEFTERYANVHAELVKGIVKEYPEPAVTHEVTPTNPRSPIPARA